ncbi:uncharacterized protein VTP21DRAFT_2849 [Calcarisporiella thermophila]|uniref:uncharacterized protein n=1 Tax=Calcarisporiella thermophila TaxID=911321 RepID=UPI00374309D0
MNNNTNYDIGCDFEVCIDSVEGAIAAENAGAARVELCNNLLEGGTTPSAGMISVCRKKVNIPIMVMIRPRGGDFCYSEEEFEAMKYDIEMAKSLGAYGVVFGILKPDGSVDKERTKILINYARPLQVTFHRAFDMTKDPIQSLEDLISLGVNRVLTSGQENSAYEGLELITKLIEQAGDRVSIMPGAGINENNIGKIMAAAHPKEVHVSASTVVDSSMIHRPSAPRMTTTFRASEFEIRRTSQQRLEELIQRSSAIE